MFGVKRKCVIETSASYSFRNRLDVQRFAFDRILKIIASRWVRFSEPVH